ncbi:rhodanese-like domain-containing protein [Arsenophonus symbiont of Ornithomya chloropus]|uniref:rhodanese-like domain-containing protein n=1 Tax=Arsenophonus symbiont of Ornithomya chloropus TaxID=634121 RepID=UPI0032B2DF31
MIKEITQFILRHPIFSLLWITLLISVIILTFQSLFSKIKKINCTETIQLINREQGVIIDIRPRNNFYKEHILNSINITFLDIKKNIHTLKQNKNIPIIIVSESEIESSKAAEQLIKYGFERVFVLKNGFIDWSNNHLPITRNHK